MQVLKQACKGFFVTPRLGANYFLVRNSHVWAEAGRLSEKKKSSRSADMREIYRVPILRLILSLLIITYQKLLPLCILIMPSL